MTIVEIAKLAGVSIGTVDRVLHHRGRVNPETARRIEEIIEREGYRANPLARHLKKARDYPIGVLIPRSDSEGGYWQLILRGIEQAVRELRAFSFVLQPFEFDRWDSESLRAAFQALGESPAVAAIVAPILQRETLDYAAIPLKKRNIPYFLVDSPLPGLEVQCTIAQNPYRGGLLAGKLMELCVPSGGPFGVVLPYRGAYNLNERRRGFYDWFRGRVAIRDIQLQDGDRGEIDDVIREAAEPSGAEKLRGIFVVSSMGYRVARSLRTFRIRPFLLGYDLIEENRRCLLSGEIGCLITQRPEEQGKQALYQIYRRLVLGEGGEKEIAMPLDLYFKENLL